MSVDILVHRLIDSRPTVTRYLVNVRSIYMYRLFIGRVREDCRHRVDRLSADYVGRLSAE